MTTLRSTLLLVGLGLALPACLEESPLAAQSASGPDEPGDPRDDAFLSGTAGTCVEPGSIAAEGVLALVNDPEVDAVLLDAPVDEGGVGLDRRAAQGIVDARPILDLAALDAVPYVGLRACEALAERACNVDRRCVVPVGLMSWNTEHFPLTPAAPEGVVDIVDEHRPAFVGLQEVEDPAAFTAMLDDLPGYTGILGEPGPFTRVGLLLDDAQADVVEVEHLFVDDGWAFPRPVLAVRAQLLHAAVPTKVTFVVVHLKAMSDATSQSRRALAVQKLRALVDQRRASGDGEVVIVGDWNDELGDLPGSNVFGPLLDEAAGATFLTLDESDAGEATLIPWGSMIDHVLATQEALDAMPHQRTEVLHLDQTWSGDYVSTVSDHRPVLSVLGLPHPW
ncbi:MAG: endonuclease/exonuclease/phosphatase family protein [Myxococcales bacterium]|nr:endonuclease/exonuclease/phosphatase family protein [Myxococcales bacterium]